MNPKLLQLASPALPVGAYSYSQGLEAAIESGIVTDAASAERWIGDVLELSQVRMEAPILLRLIEAFARGDHAAIARWNEEFVASRETAELRAETLQMGYSLRNLLRDLGLPLAGRDSGPEIAYPTAYAHAVAHWKIDPLDAVATYLFAWLENQVLAAVKTIPLGQTDGQRMLLRLGGRIAAAVERAARLTDDELGNFAPGLALASSRHETQYSRLFRS